MTRIRAFVLGVYEFRRSFTTAWGSYDELVAYDWGRELAHLFTLRHFEEV